MHLAAANRLYTEGGEISLRETSRIRGNSMKKLAVAVAVTALLGAGAAAEQRIQPQNVPAPVASPKMATSHPSTQVEALTVESQNQLVGQYCATCHSERGKAGGLVLAGFDVAKVEEHPDVAEKMIRKLRAGMMPPPNAKHPDVAVVRALVDSLETRIDAAAALNPNPGWRPFQRLNRAEYQHAVRDLLGIDVDVTAFLPPDTISRGFDNVADVQSFSPTLMESYLRAASQISRLAVGDRNATATSVTYKIGRTASQMRHVDGAPMGTRGGISVVHTFPADGDYVVKMSMHNEPLGGIYGRTTMATMDIKEQVEVSVNGERAALLDLNVRMSETDPKNSLDVKTAADSHRRRSAAHLGRVHSAIRWSGRRPARPAREHAGRREHQLRRDGAAAHARRHDPRADQRHGRVGHDQPPARVLVPADLVQRRGDVCGGYREAT